ncbi:sulfatase-like hydrolase/transferase [Planctomycetota bacterium]
MSTRNLSILWLLVSPCVLLAESALPDKPNVVLILIDDLSHYGVTAYGAGRISSAQGDFENRLFATPQIDRLAVEGLRCDNAYTYPLCEPTRIALMSGQYNSRNFLRCKAQHASEITFGDVFQRAGYATGIFGKWKQTRGTKEVHGKDYIFEFGWDEFCCFDVVGEAQRFINPNLVINGKIHNYMGRSDLDPATGRRWYGPDICNRYALNFIDRRKDKPFFLYYPMLLVHDEHKPTPDTQPHFLFDSFDEANHNRDGHTGDDRRYFPDMLAYMDKLIGKVVSKLDEHKLRKKTLVIVMGDNGTKECFAHVLSDGTVYPGGKGGNKDNGMHVPLIFSWPGTIPAGQDGQIRHYDGLVDVTDIYPTLCAAMGLTIPNSAALDGIDFWPQVMGATGEARQVIYTWYNGNSPATDLSQVLRYAFNKEFKRYAPHADYPQGRFFDLRSDPLEMVGDRKVRRKFNHYHRSGLNLAQLTVEQQAAYDELGKVINAHGHVPVTGLHITGPMRPLELGSTVTLTCRVTPAQATRQNVIWESSDATIASVDKFGLVTPHAPGSIKITAYSWDDAYPVAANMRQTYSRNGIQDSWSLTVLP